MRAALPWVAMVVSGCLLTPPRQEGKLCSSSQPCDAPLICVPNRSGPDGVCRTEACPGAAELCELQLGLCSGARRACLPSGYELVCTVASYDAGYEERETLCDGVDNDCDGRVDAVRDGGALVGTLCEQQAGVCAGSRRRCTPSGFELSCGAASYPSTFEAFETSCDGLDNDCDGTPDSARGPDPGFQAGTMAWVPGGLTGQGLLALFLPPSSGPGGGLLRVGVRTFDGDLRPMTGQGLALTIDAKAFRLARAAGSVALLYVTSSGGGQADALRVARLDPSGGRVQTIRTDGGSGDPELSAGAPITAFDVAPEAGGGFGAVWVELTDAGQEVRAVQLDSNGEPKTAPVVLSTSSPMITARSEPTILASPPGFLVGWQEIDRTVSGSFVSRPLDGANAGTPSSLPLGRFSAPRLGRTSAGVGLFWVSGQGRALGFQLLDGGAPRTLVQNVDHVSYSELPSGEAVAAFSAGSTVGVTTSTAVRVVSDGGAQSVAIAPLGAAFAVAVLGDGGTISTHRVCPP